MWENENVFSYTGEGQRGDMEFTRGNLALKDHVRNGRRVFLFQQSRRGFVRFVSEMTFFDADYYNTYDTHGNQRVAIKFFFKRVGAEIAYELEKNSLVEDPAPGYLKRIITERSALVLSRVGQDAYRKSIINRWEHRCAVTGFSDARILIASHIHPWKSASDEQRLDVNNGILLSPTYDALFDTHLITFDHSGQIVLSGTLEKSECSKIRVSGKERIAKLNSGNHKYLEYHQQIFYEKTR